MAGISIGIVGLPNVGKSTLFRALTAVAVPAENYPFCTIDPNVGVVEVPDLRLDRLHEMTGRKRKVPTVVEFVDIAGLVEGASEGEGLGNRFLANIRDVDAMAHVLRCFEEPSVASVGDPGHPETDLAVVELELALADLESVLGALDRAERRARSGDREAASLAGLLRRLQRALEAGRPARSIPLEEEDRNALRGYSLLTLKPALYVANVGEEELGTEPASVCRLRDAVGPDAEIVVLCARLEAELLDLEPGERAEYLRTLGIEGRGLDRLIRAGYRLLGLQTFFTIGDHEVRAWTVRRGATAPEAAGRVHTDFERGFIRAETIAWQDFVEAGSLQRARELGTLRQEGKDYVVRDGDILFFRAGS